MQRILIVGSPGSGKSTLAREIGRRLDIPIVHLDRLFWRPGWKHVSPGEFEQAIADATTGPRWILDGNYGRSLVLRLSEADTVIFLDLPPLVCLLRVMWRQFVGRYRDRADMADGCRESPDFEFFDYVWEFREKERPKIMSRINSRALGQVIVLRTPSEVRQWLAHLSRLSQ